MVLTIKPFPGGARRVENTLAEVARDEPEKGAGAPLSSGSTRAGQSRDAHRCAERQLRARQISWEAMVVAMVLALAAALVAWSFHARPLARGGDKSAARFGFPSEGHGGCWTKVQEKPLYLQPGDSVAGDMGWESCQLYDGHPVIIYSAAPKS